MASPLEHRIKALIRLTGPLAVADYMAICLGDPEHGYYMAHDPFGAAGDFVTAPEVSQMFGELVGLWAVDTWERFGRPTPFQLVELGPGRGTLMADVLRAARLVPEFLAGARLHMVETSTRLRERQRATLAKAPLVPTWHDSIAGLPAGPAIILANEFFDALPIRQYVKTGGIWRERVVGMDDTETLTFGLGPGVLDAPAIPADARGAPDGAVLETGTVANAVMQTLADRLVTEGGALLAIDYGYGRAAPGDSFQAVRHHNYVDPLAAPGEVDLTAHVNFEALARAARDAGATAHTLMDQGQFLLRLGLAERAGSLGATADEETRARLTGEVTRLVHPDEMGTLFKVLAVTQPGVTPAPWG
jgi:SAM-dependent MidA family methyltransferase